MLQQHPTHNQWQLNCSSVTGLLQPNAFPNIGTVAFTAIRDKVGEKNLNSANCSSLK